MIQPDEDRHPNKKVRSIFQVKGLTGLTGETTRKVRDANTLASVAADLAEEVANLGGAVTIENPGPSYLWRMPRYLKLVQKGWTRSC